MVETMNNPNPDQNKMMSVRIHRLFFLPLEIRLVECQELVYGTCSDHESWMVVEERTFFGNFCEHTCELSLHAVCSPFLQRAFSTVRPRVRKKTKDIQLEVDDQFAIPYPLDGINRLYVCFPAGKTSPFLDRAGFEELYSWTIPV